jgi:hypothetical protein
LGECVVALGWGWRRGPRGVDYLDGNGFGGFEVWLDELG